MGLGLLGLGCDALDADGLAHAGQQSEVQHDLVRVRVRVRVRV